VFDLGRGGFSHLELTDKYLNTLPIVDRSRRADSNLPRASRDRGTFRIAGAAI